jgi:hypothetical protein
MNKILIAILMMAAQAWADTLYVNFDSPTNGTGISTNPWNNWTSVFAADRNSVIKCWGTYHQKTGVLYFDATRKQLTYIPNGSDSLLVILHGPGRRIVVQDTSIIYGWKITSSNDSGARSDSDYELYIDAHNTKAHGIQISSATGTGIYTRKRNVLIKDSRVTHLYGGHGITLDGPLDTVLNCHIDTITGQNDAIAIAEGADSCLVRGSYLNIRGAEKSCILIRGGMTSNLIGVTIENNWLDGPVTVAGIDCDATAGGSGGYHIYTIRYIGNLITTTHAAGGENATYANAFRFNGAWLNDTSIGPNIIAHNTVVSRGNFTNQTLERGSIVMGTHDDTVNIVKCYNNIFYTIDSASSGNVYSRYALYATDTFPHWLDSANCFYSSEGLTQYGRFRTSSSSIGLNPLFASAVNFSLSATSPCKSVGFTISGITQGLKPVTTFPNPELVALNSPPDMGAFPFAAPSTTTIKSKVKQAKYSAKIYGR